MRDVAEYRVATSALAPAPHPQYKRGVKGSLSGDAGWTKESKDKPTKSSFRLHPFPHLSWILIL